MNILNNTFKKTSTKCSLLKPSKHINFMFMKEHSGTRLRRLLDARQIDYSDFARSVQVSPQALNTSQPHAGFFVSGDYSKKYKQSVDYN